MAYTALYREWRPRTFNDVVGQEHIIRTLKNQIENNNVGHAYLFSGTRGTGKTSCAKILARAVNCVNSVDGEPCNECEVCKGILNGTITDVIEMDAASNNSVENIRQIRQEVVYATVDVKYRVYIIDEVHMLTTSAFNALLKTLEEPPSHVKFILATTESKKLPATILSRCQRFDFKRISNENIIKDLKYSQRSLDMELGRCAFTEDKISGMITYSPTEVREHPEYMSDDGSFEWDLRYDIRQDLFNGYNGREGHWSPTGIKTVFAGSVIVDGREYNVIPKSSFGYVDKFWGETLPESWIHLSASHLTSIITGRILEDSSFAIQGIFNDRLSLVLKIEDKEIVFSADSSKRSYTTVWDCSSIVSDDSGEKLHWSVSFHNKNYVVDVDVFCVTSNLFVRTWELPEGQRKVLKVLAGSSGVGELRVYKRIKKKRGVLCFSKWTLCF